MKKYLQYGLALLALLVSACATQGGPEFIRGTMPRNEKFTIVAHNQRVPDWWLDQGQLKLNFLVKGEVSKEQMVAVAEAERVCRIYAGVVRPSNLVAVLSSGILYGAAGWAGVGLGARAFLSQAGGIKTSAYARYGGDASAFAGVANGMISLGGQTYTFENCGRELLELFPGYEVKVLQKSPY